MPCSIESSSSVACIFVEWRFWECGDRHTPIDVAKHAIVNTSRRPEAQAHPSANRMNSLFADCRR
jgi:hypothetical protein